MWQISLIIIVKWKIVLSKHHIETYTNMRTKLSLINHSSHYGSLRFRKIYSKVLIQIYVYFSFSRIFMQRNSIPNVNHFNLYLYINIWLSVCCCVYHLFFWFVCLLSDCVANVTHSQSVSQSVYGCASTNIIIKKRLSMF